MHRPKLNVLFNFVLFLTIVLLPGCAQATAVQTVAPPTSLPALVAETPQATKTQIAIGLDPRSLQNLEYRLKIIEESEPGSSGIVKLNDGVFEQSLPNSSAKLQVNYVDSAVGDLNSDGIEDAVVLLAINTGGTGTFMQLAAVLNQGGLLKHIDTSDLGDRVKIDSIRIEDGTIKVQMVVHSDTDPQCCPSLEKLQEFVVQGERLLSVESQ